MMLYFTYADVKYSKQHGGSRMMLYFTYSEVKYSKQPVCNTLDCSTIEAAL